jgi:hypothetical protein
MMEDVVNITVTQVTQLASVPARTGVFSMNFANKIEVNSSWKNLTDKAIVTLPKNVYILNATTGKPVPMGSPGQPGVPSASINIGGTLGTVAPLFLRGDRITIQMGIKYPSAQNTDGTYAYTTTLSTVFTGFISEVVSGIPIVLHCEDNMWALKQLAGPGNKTYSAGVNNLGDILADLQTAVTIKNTAGQVPIPGLVILQGTQNNVYQVNIGTFQTRNETWAMILDRLRKEWHLFFNFRGNILRAGGLVYYPEDTNTIGNFIFDGDTGNIFPEDHLIYQRKEDVSIGAQCYSVNKIGQNKTNATGGTRTIDKKLQCIVYSQNGNFITSANAPPDKNAFTEFFTFFFPNVTTQAALQLQGQIKLQRFYYDGYRGKFKTFGLPFMQYGNLAALTSNNMPERNGTYIIKSNKLTFEAAESGGIEQEIEVHFRTDTGNMLEFIQTNGG